MAKSGLLIIGKHLPEPRSSAAGSRMMQIIEALIPKYKITFATSAGDSEFAEDLPGYIEFVRIDLNSSSFDVFVKALNPDVVLFDRFMTEEQFGWRVAYQCPDALRILDMEDLHALRHGREVAAKESRAFSKRDLVQEVAKREVASIYRCDLSLVISEYEMELLQSFYNVPKSLLYYLPFMVPADQIRTSVPYSDRQHFITIGNFLHSPNLDSVEYLKTEIWPKIHQQLPNTEMHIYGAYTSDKVRRMEDRDMGFLIKGRAEEVDRVMESARVCLSPLRFGAGLKGKLLAAMQSNTPSVTTSVGAEAMSGGLSWPGYVADTPDEIANAAVELYRNQNIWEEKSSLCAPLVKQRFHREFWQPALRKALEDMQQSISAHRLENFTGAMLQFHTMRSTEFMSRWIELKNKLSKGGA